MKRIEKVEPWFRDFDGWWYVTRRRERQTYADQAG